MDTKKKKAVKEQDYAREQAKAQLESILEMVEALETKDDDKREEAQTAIQEDPLSVQVRSGWYTPGEKAEAEEFEILLCTGGPAVRILGELGQHDEPKRAWIQYQDWGTPWTDYIPSMIDGANEALLTYCRQFYFGE